MKRDPFTRSSFYLVINGNKKAECKVFWESILSFIIHQFETNLHISQSSESQGLKLGVEKKSETERKSQSLLPITRTK